MTMRTSDSPRTSSTPQAMMSNTQPVRLLASSAAMIVVMLHTHCAAIMVAAFTLNHGRSFPASTTSFAVTRTSSSSSQVGHPLMFSSRSFIDKCHKRTRPLHVKCVLLPATILSAVSDDKEPETMASTESTNPSTTADATPVDITDGSVATPTPKLTSSRDPSRRPNGTFMRTLVLAVPLFFKFVIVLLIKFATDLVVIPMLLLYRLARRTKRRILSLFGVTANNKKQSSSPLLSEPTTMNEIDSEVVNGSGLPS